MVRSSAKKILAPVDGSQYMERNLGYICGMVKSMGSKLTLIHVVSLPDPGHAWSPSVEFPPHIRSLKKPLEESASTVLDKARNIAKLNGVDADTILQTTYGNPAQAIVNVAEEQKFDLILIGAKGHSLLRNLSVGSVCDAVLHNAPCPVLVVR